MATIAIGQRIGSGGGELGALIARRLEARFLGLDDLRREAASRYRVDREQLRVFDTREPHFWERLTTDTRRLLTYFHAVILKHLAEDSDSPRQPRDASVGTQEGWSRVARAYSRSDGSANEAGHGRGNVCPPDRRNIGSMNRIVRFRRG
jgi:hypothetical protein